MEKKEEKKEFTGADIVKDLKTGSLLGLKIFIPLEILSLLLMAFCFSVARFITSPSIVISILAILLFTFFPAFCFAFIIYHLIAYFIYSSDKLKIVEDTLYKTIPYEKVNRYHSSRYTKRYNHGMYFQKYGKYTVISENFSIDFDATKEYYLVILDFKKPKILSCRRKDKYELKK